MDIAQMAKETAADPALAVVVAGAAGRLQREREAKPVASRDGRSRVLHEDGTVAEPLAADPDKLLTADEVAALLSVATATVWALSRDERIPTVRIRERTLRYRRGAVLEWIEALERESGDG